MLSSTARKWERTLSPLKAESFISGNGKMIPLWKIEWAQTSPTHTSIYCPEVLTIETGGEKDKELIYWNCLSSFSVTSFSSLTTKQGYSQNYSFPFFYPTFLSDLGLFDINHRESTLDAFPRKFPYHPPLASKGCRKQILPQKASLVQFNNTNSTSDLYCFSFCTDSTGGGITNTYWHPNWHRGNSWQNIQMRSSTGVLLGAALKAELLLPSVRRSRQQLSLLTSLSLDPRFSPQANRDIFGFHYLLTGISSNSLYSRLSHTEISLRYLKTSYPR